MSNIIAIGTAVPRYRHSQQSILNFMQAIYQTDETENRKLAFLYHQSQIGYRYSVLPDFSLPANEFTFLPNNSSHAFPDTETRQALFDTAALPLALQAVSECLNGCDTIPAITHLITISCTGMSAPGLDLELVEALSLPNDTTRSSINYMGCYAAVHALKMADYICKAEPDAQVLLVGVELCTLHFQQQYTIDNATSSMLFADGAAAVLVSNDESGARINKLQSFYSRVANGGKNDMSWKLSSQGFLMKLSSYVPQLIAADISDLVANSAAKAGVAKSDITHWCIHPGGKKILETIAGQLLLEPQHLQASYDVLHNYGNMSSVTILFVLKQILAELASHNKPALICGAAFGPGLTMETFMLAAS